MAQPTSTQVPRRATGAAPATATGRADLVPDGGAAAACPAAFFRSPGYLESEGVTHTLIVDDGAAGSASIPLVVRDIPGTTLRDAVSPYGYPGGSREGDRPDLAAVDFSGVDLVSIFVRERAIDPTFTGGTVKGHLYLHDPRIERHCGKSFVRAVRRCAAAGYRVGVVRGRDADEALLRDLHDVYTQTMRRRHASPRFERSPGYVAACAATGSAWIAYAVSPSGALAAADLLVVSDGVLHSLLFGTADEFLPDSPGKAVTMRELDLADQLGRPFNVGGGLTSGDGLELSKQSYCNRSVEFACHEIVPDPDSYARLSGPVSTGFFPAYRAG